jgi:SAM-dependent methyltransferase
LVTLSAAVLAGRRRPSPAEERRFFEKLRMPNGTWKTTYPHRLDDLNAALLSHLPRDRRLDAMDVGISSGVSTLEWVEQLQDAGVDCRIVAGDLGTRARLASWGDSVAIVFDGSGRRPLLLEVGGLAVPVFSARRSVRLVRSLLEPALRPVGRRARRLWLVVPGLRERPEVELVEDDVTVPGHLEGAFDVVRAANLVQRSYFDDATLRLILANLRSRLRPGGLLALCQSIDDGNHATIFRLDGDHFSAIASLGDGVGVGDLVLSL